MPADTENLATQDWTAAGSAQALPELGRRVVHIGMQEVLVCRAGGQIHAVHNRCPHGEASLAEGRLSAGFILCMAHGARFDIATGKHLGAMRCPPLKRRAVRVENDEIWVGEVL